MGVTIKQFQEVNSKRNKLWQPNTGTLVFWGLCLAGEVGEVCNIIKKIDAKRRGVIGYKDSNEELLKQFLAEEMADVLAYLVLVAEKEGIDMESIAVSKFDEVSQRHGFPSFRELVQGQIEEDDRAEPKPEPFRKVKDFFKMFFAGIGVVVVGILLGWIAHKVLTLLSLSIGQ